MPDLFWVGNLELRIPVYQGVDVDIADHMVGLRGVSIVPFYDVGGVYVDGQVVENVAHALGLGLRADVALFSFMERMTLSFDIAKTVNAASPFQFWFGAQHAF